MYEAVNNQSETGRSDTYMLSSVSDMSDDDFRRCSDVSRQSSSRYAENKPLIRASQSLAPGVERNLLTTISSVMQSQSMRVAPQHHHRTSILSTISGLRYTDPTQPGLPSLPPMSCDQAPGQETPEAPVQVTTNVDGDQFVCLNLNNQNGEQQSYITTQDLSQLQQYQQQQQQSFDISHSRPQFTTAPTAQQQSFVTQQPSQLINFGTIQAPVHSQLVIQRVGTLPRQYAHPLAQL